VLLERGFFGLRRHFSCHYVGLEPVDPAIRRPFEPGVVITIGPGLYDRQNGIGIRIEDVVLITEDGARVLTHDVPKERLEVEARLGDRGVLDWVGTREN
jgi:Xaa-Pro aminopeptidase